MGRTKKGQAPFGYRWQGGQLRLNEQETATRRTAFDLFITLKSKIMSWGCPDDGRADLRFPDWNEDLRHKVLEAFPVVNGEIRSPLDELRKRQQEGIAWPYPLPQE